MDFSQRREARKECVILLTVMLLAIIEILHSRLSDLPSSVSAQCVSGSTPTCGILANPVSRACSSKPLLRQKKAPGIVVGITSA